MADIKQDDQILCSGCLCYNVTLYTDVPECVGCSGQGTCLCCEESFCCKLGGEPLSVGVSTDDPYICKLGCFCLEYACMKPTTCCKYKMQECCFVASGALPPTDDIPMTFALCGLSLFPAVGCFKKMSDLTS